MGYKLVYYGDEILKKPARKVENIDQDIIDLIDVMFNVMYKEKGVGLAANQIAVPKKILTIDVEHSGGPVIALLNPEIVKKCDELVPYEEGCLSFPGINAEIMRPSQITVKAVTPEGNEIKLDADGMFARVLQHEIDHLNGIVFIDHIEDFLRKELTQKLKKIKKLNKEK